MSGVAPPKAPAARRYALPEGWVSVTDSAYGAVGDGVTNDDAAFQAAVATGRNVYIPQGTLASPKHYLLSQTIYPQQGQTIYCDGWNRAGSYVGWSDWMANLSTCILWIGTSNYCFDMKEHRSVVDGIMVMQNTGYVPTAGGAFKLGNASVQQYSPVLKNCASVECYRGLYIAGKIILPIISDTAFMDSVGADYEINIAVPYGAIQGTNWRSAGGARGLYVRQCDTSRIIGLQINNTSGAGIDLAGDLGPIHQIFMDDVIMEDVSSSGDTVVIGNGSYTVQDCSMTNFHCYRATESTITLGANAARFTMSNLHSRSVRYIDNGDSNELLGGKIHPNSGTSAYTAITLNGTNAIISDLRISGFTNALTFGAGANYALLSSLNLNNNTNALAAASNAAAKATGKGRGIMGLADWG